VPDILIDARIEEKDQRQQQKQPLKKNMQAAEE
jgi:hypothetical protein